MWFGLNCSDVQVWISQCCHILRDSVKSTLHVVDNVYKFIVPLVCIQAFEIARSLGIACTLTPNMMVTATVPDKLAVTSFVYQMYQYFTKATQSAITRQNSRNVGSGANSPTGQL